MIDPITATLAVNAGSRLAGGLADVATATAQKLVGALPTVTMGQPVAFNDSLQDVAKSAFHKLFAAHPGLQAQLGAGPYALTQDSSGTLTLSSQKTGNFVTLDPSTAFGRQAQFLADAFQLKNLEKGLEFSAV